MSERELSEQLLELIERRLGIAAAPGRTPGWLASRLERAARGLVGNTLLAPRDVVGYFGSHPAELERLAELVRVGETRFFRDPEQWEALATALRRRPSASGKLFGLSAGCSTGEEAWTLAMVLANAELGSFRVVGVDRSSVALDQARSGSYEAECEGNVPAAYARHVQVQAATLHVSQALRACVSFAQRDLLSGPPPGNYDVIVCKNLLIYLSHEAALRVLRSLFAALTPGGLLLVARAELPKAKALDLPVVSLAPGINLVQAP